IPSFLPRPRHGRPQPTNLGNPREIFQGTEDVVVRRAGEGTSSSSQSHHQLRAYHHTRRTNNGPRPLILFLIPPCFHITARSSILVSNKPLNASSNSFLAPVRSRSSPPHSSKTPCTNQQNNLNF